MAGAVSAIFLLDVKGRVLVWRDYRGDVTAVQAERFFTKLIEKEVSRGLLYILSAHRPDLVGHSFRHKGTIALNMFVSSGIEFAIFCMTDTP